MKLPMPLRRKDPVETLIVLLGAVLVVVFAFFMARGDLDRYAELLVTREIPSLVEVVEKEEVVPISPLEQWAQEFPQSSPIGITEEIPSPPPVQEDGKNPRKCRKSCNRPEKSARKPLLLRGVRLFFRRERFPREKTPGQWWRRSGGLGTPLRSSAFQGCTG
jgi:hypothetical protein